MYPDLSYLFHDLFGSNPDNWLSIFKTFGVFLILAFLASAYVLKVELTRKEREGLLYGTLEKVKTGFPATWGEIATNAFFGFILGFKLPYILLHFDEFRPDPASVLLSTKGTLLWGIAGAALFGFLRYWDSRKRQLPKPVISEEMVMPHQRVGDMTILAAIFGLIGARLASIIESKENLKEFFRDPLEQLLSGSGLAIYGGLILAFLVALRYLKRKHIPAMPVLDAAAPALIMGYAVGRIGCQISGDGDWGIETPGGPPSWWFLPDWAWSYTYPNNVLNEGVQIEGCIWQYCHELSAGVYPTPIYETFFSLIIFGILLALRKHIRIPGVIFFLYVLLNGIERFFIEKIRTNPDIELFGMQASQAEYISFLLVLIGIGGIIWMYVKDRESVRT